MNNTINVLVFPCGSEIGLEINSALRDNKTIRLFGLSSVPSHGQYVYENYSEDIPFVTDETFIPSLNAFIEHNEIDFIIPAIDDLVLFLAENSSKISCKVLGSEYKTCLICRSKSKTYSYFGNYNFVPQTYCPETITGADYPLFAKPDVGQGSQGILILRDDNDLERLLLEDKLYVISELLTGDEYTVDCFTDRHGTLLVASMRDRIRIKSGIAVESRLIDTPPEVLGIAETINSNLCFSGTWYFQIKKNGGGEYRLLEIAPRVAGTMGASRVRGFNFVLNSIYDALGLPLSIISNSQLSVEVSRALISRYSLGISYDFVYLDFDDTLVVNGRVNTLIIALLYQFVSAGKSIILLSRHQSNLFESLKRYQISVSLFSNIHVLSDTEKKSSYITEKSAILIDDSFKERQDVHTTTGIPVFDVDAAEALVNWRR